VILEKVHRYTGFSVTVDPDELKRYLGYRRDKEPYGELAGLLTETSKEAESLAEPAAILSTFDVQSIPEDTFLFTLFDTSKVKADNGHAASSQAAAAREKGSRTQIVLAICTIGPRLEERVSEYSESGELARALILDAAGSSLAEAVCDFANQKICEMATQKSLYASARISPGYAGWKVEEQEIIFALLPADSIGVSLTKSFMMVPRKSVSFAVKVAGDEPTDEAASPCVRCRRKECEFRR